MSLSPSEVDLVARTRAFARERLTPAAAEWSAAAVAELQREAATLGLTRIEVPTADGGLGFGFACKARVCEALAAVDFGFALSVVNTHNVAHKIAGFARPEAKAGLLPELLDGRASACTALTEPHAGSDFFAIATRARPEAKGWVLEGEKTWIVNGRNAALALVYAQCAEPGDRDGIGAFVVDLRDSTVERYAIDAAVSQTSIQTGGFRLRGYHAQSDALILPPGEAFRSILTEINGARCYVAAMCCGLLDAALAVCAAYGQERKSFGKPLAGHQAWRFALARAESDLAAARALTRQAEAVFLAGDDTQLLAAQAKLVASAACERHLPNLLHAMGAEGLRTSHPFVRHCGAAALARLVDGSDEMLLERVARLARPTRH
ncbi:MAG: acyl-CoA dehydrogenase family protein [Rhodospirillales bacterium]